MVSGTVVTFDAAVGWGVVRSDRGAEHPFHCTAVADGSRHVEPGTAVAFTVVAGHNGRWEASSIRPLHT